MKFISFLLCFILCFNLMPVITLAMFDNVFQIEFSGPPEAVLRLSLNIKSMTETGRFITRIISVHHPGPKHSVTEIKFKQLRQRMRAIIADFIK